MGVEFLLPEDADADEIAFAAPPKAEAMIDVGIDADVGFVPVGISKTASVENSVTRFPAELVVVKGTTMSVVKAPGGTDSDAKRPVGNGSKTISEVARVVMTEPAELVVVTASTTPVVSKLPEGIASTGAVEKVVNTEPAALMVVIGMRIEVV